MRTTAQATQHPPSQSSGAGACGGAARKGPAGRPQGSAATAQEQPTLGQLWRSDPVFRGAPPERRTSKSPPNAQYQRPSAGRRPHLGCDRLGFSRDGPSRSGCRQRPPCDRPGHSGCRPGSSCDSQNISGCCQHGSGRCQNGSCDCQNDSGKELSWSGRGREWASRAGNRGAGGLSGGAKCSVCVQYPTIWAKKAGFSTASGFVGSVTNDRWITLMVSVRILPPRILTHSRCSASTRKVLFIAAR